MITGKILLQLNYFEKIQQIIDQKKHLIMIN